MSSPRLVAAAAASGAVFRESSELGQIVKNRSPLTPLIDESGLDQNVSPYVSVEPAIKLDIPSPRRQIPVRHQTSKVHPDIKHMPESSDVTLWRGIIDGNHRVVKRAIEAGATVHSKIDGKISAYRAAKFLSHHVPGEKENYLGICQTLIDNKFSKKGERPKLLTRTEAAQKESPFYLEMAQRYKPGDYKKLNQIYLSFTQTLESEREKIKHESLKKSPDEERMLSQKARNALRAHQHLLQHIVPKISPEDAQTIVFYLGEAIYHQDQKAFDALLLHEIPKNETYVLLKIAVQYGTPHMVESLAYYTPKTAIAPVDDKQTNRSRLVLDYVFERLGIPMDVTALRAARIDVRLSLPGCSGQDGLAMIESLVKNRADIWRIRKNFPYTFAEYIQQRFPNDYDRIVAMNPKPDKSVRNDDSILDD
jgi:hypothetical protein